MLEFNRCRNGQQVKPFTHAPVPVNAWEPLPGAAVSGFFVFYAHNRPCVGANTTGMGENCYCGEGLREQRGWRR